MATNDFLPFAFSEGANVLSQQDYENLKAMANGFSSGVAKSAELNKVWRQSSIMSTVLAQLIVDGSGQDAIDDGTTATLLANLKTVLSQGNTQPLYDNSTKLATTQFVQRALGNFQDAPVIDSAITLTAADVGKCYSINQGGSLTLPLLSSVAKGSAFLICATYATTVATQGEDTIFVGGDDQITSLPLNPADWVLIVSNRAVDPNGRGQWQVFSGSILESVNSAAKHVWGDSGYIQFPSWLGGFMIQWTTWSGLTGGNSGTNNYQNTFSEGFLGFDWPTPFSRQCFFATANADDATDVENELATVSSRSTSGGKVNFKCLSRGSDSPIPMSGQVIGFGV